MRILFLAQRFPFPPDRGDRIRSFHILRHLARRHEVVLAAVSDEDVTERQWTAMKELCAGIDVGRIHAGRRRLASAFYLPTMTPLTLPSYYCADLRRKVEERLRTERLDLVFAYCSSVAPYVRKCGGIPKVIDFVDADSQKWLDYARSTRFPQSLVYAREGHLLRRYERRIAAECRHAFVASNRERSTLERFVHGTPITAIRNGVTISDSFHTRRSGFRMVFTGVMDYWPNEDAVCDFTDRIFPRIRREIPEAEFVIVGQRPTPRVMRLGGIPGVSVTGRVPDPAVYMAEAAVFVAPIRVARGIQNKVLEAMACGLPVVATRAAADGLEAREGEEFLLGDSPESFAAQTVQLLRDGTLGEHLAGAAGEYIRKRHDWTANMQVMEDILLDVVGSRR